MENYFHIISSKTKKNKNNIFKGLYSNFDKINRYSSSDNKNHNSKLSSYYT